MKNIYFIIIFSFSLFANGHSESSSDHKSKKALQKFEKGKGFLLSEPSLKTMGVEFIEYRSFKDSKVPTSAIAFIKNKKGVYVLRDGFIRFLEFKEGFALRANDLLVTKGLGVIAITDVFSKDSSDYSHAH